jgi:hypothetical protein
LPAHQTDLQAIYYNTPARKAQGENHRHIVQKYGESAAIAGAHDILPVQSNNLPVSSLRTREEAGGFLSKNIFLFFQNYKTERHADGT